MDLGLAGRACVITGGDRRAGEEEIATLPLDLAEHDAGEQMLGAVLEAFDRVDVLVNAAGAAGAGESLEVADSDWRTVVFLCSERASYVAGAIWPVDAATPQVVS
ncbi:MAG TPA: SDR family oxidoreductase [Solirubrobacterales bacterium]|jgi:NAD(P)-dependent dehydrogenase (short-subunit alcohol dehydrogenase family)